MIMLADMIGISHTCACWSILSTSELRNNGDAGVVRSRRIVSMLLLRWLAEWSNLFWMKLLFAEEEVVFMFAYPYPDHENKGNWWIKSSSCRVYTTKIYIPISVYTINSITLKTITGWCLIIRFFSI